MDIKQDQCVCLFYKNMTVLEGEIPYYKEKVGSQSQYRVGGNNSKLFLARVVLGVA